MELLFLAQGSGLDVLMMATPSGIAIVGCLVLLSTFSWSVMISKLFMLRKMRKQSEHFLRMFRGQQNPLELYEMGNRFPYAPPAHVYRMACAELSYFLSNALERQGGQVTRFPLSPKVSSSQMEAVNASIDRAVGEATVRIEDKTTILATAVSGAPFLGLLGTVWGVMDTFSAVARDSGVASLQSMAPGVSSALVTTVVGLLVAIPAMFGYNFIVNRIRVMTIRLDNYASELQSVLTKRFLADSSLSFAGQQPDDRSYAIRDDEAEQEMERSDESDSVHSHAPTPEPDEDIIREPKEV
ncbi:MAG: biopolymer transport protein TolQ [Verrucomicrobiales bacterium]